MKIFESEAGENIQCPSSYHSSDFWLGTLLMMENTIEISKIRLSLSKSLLDCKVTVFTLFPD